MDFGDLLLNRSRRSRKASESYGHEQHWSTKALRKIERLLKVRE